MVIRMLQQILSFVQEMLHHHRHHHTPIAVMQSSSIITTSIYLLLIIALSSCIQLDCGAAASAYSSSSSSSSPHPSTTSTSYYAPSASAASSSSSSSSIPSGSGGLSFTSPVTGPILILSLSLRGHLVPLTRLADELVRRGHRVTFAVQEDGREYVNKTKARFQSIGRLPYSKSERREKLKQICHDNSFFRGYLRLLSDIYLPNAPAMYKSLHTIVARDTPKLIIVDVACLAGLDLAHDYDIPYIINHPSVPMRLEHEPHYISQFRLPSGSVAATITASSSHGLIERAVNFVYPRLLSVALTPAMMELNRLRWMHELPLYHSPSHVLEAHPTTLTPSWTQWHYGDVEKFEVLKREHSTLTPSTYIEQPTHARCQTQVRPPSAQLINTAFGIEYAQPLPQTVIFTGPLMPILPQHDGDESEGAEVASSPLFPAIPSNLLSWLEKSNKPVILVLFGSGTMSYLDSWQVKSLAAGLTDSRFRVLWSLRTDGKTLLGTNIPNSFRIKTNFPQLPIIAHRHVRLIISPCGSATVHESLYYGKPLLCIPLYSDQLDLSLSIVTRGFGLSMEKSHLEVSEISRHVLTLVRNSTYRNSAKRMGKILRSMDGTNLAADAVQRVMRHETMRSLKQPEQLSCWHQVYQLDLIAFLFAVLILAILLLRSIYLLLGVGAMRLRTLLTRSIMSSLPEERLTLAQVRSVESAATYARQLWHGVAMFFYSSRSSTSISLNSHSNGDRTHFPSLGSTNSSSSSAATPPPSLAASLLGSAFATAGSTSSFTSRSQFDDDAAADEDDHHEPDQSKSSIRLRQQLNDQQQARK